MSQGEPLLQRRDPRAGERESQLVKGAGAAWHCFLFCTRGVDSCGRRLHGVSVVPNHTCTHIDNAYSNVKSFEQAQSLSICWPHQ